MNRSAFTLIEVLVSVTILAVVATGLFQISMNSKNNFAFLKQKAQFDRLASIPLVHNDPKYNHTQKDLFEFVRDDYEIKEDEIRKALKAVKVNYTQEEYATFSPFSEASSESEDSPEDDEMQNGMDMTLVFDKITIYDKQNSTFVYKLQLK
jgi:prepilin-type N-terminal cleavage/methylation domain-containing protein